MRTYSLTPHRIRFSIAVVCCFALLLPSGTRAIAPSEAPAAAENSPATIPPEQLDSLIAPIALYPDDLLAQVLVASTYPLEIIQLQQWLMKNPDLEGDALADAVAKQPWDPSVQSMAAIPEAVDRLANDVQWTTELGNAFLAQQSDVMDAAQRMRQKAQDKGALESNEQQNVETVVVAEKTIIVVESADPEIIYVPSYSPTVVYGAPLYPYPPVYYPPYTAGAAFVTFGIAIAWGAAWGGSCCGCGWGGNNVNINVHNNFNRNINVGGGGKGGAWKHNPQHRGGTPYSDRATANKYGGRTGGDASTGRQQTARQQGAARTSGTGAGGNRSASTATGRSTAPSASGAGRSTADTRSSSANQIGSRSLPSNSSRSAGGYGGGSSGYSGSSARSRSARGASSMGSMGSRGGSRGGGRRR
jgi:hypothetical protein